MISIITPSYNRAYKLNDAYESLKKQSCKDFEWIIVDDGSSDNTKEIVNEFIKENKIKIIYKYKKNGGKHTAVNEGVKLSNGKYVLILDSDDTLLENAIELIKQYWNKYDDNKKIACLSFIKIFPNNKTIGKEYNEKEIVSNHIDFRYNKDLLGDMCEVFKTEILKKYPFPIFKGERFLSEAIIWNTIAFDYDTAYINKPIYVADYLDDGLSKNFFKLVYKNPNGARLNSNMFLNKKFKLKIRLKNAILYDGYSIVSKIKLKNIIGESNNKLLSLLFLVPGYIYYHFLKYKNKKLQLN